MSPSVVVVARTVQVLTLSEEEWTDVNCGDGQEGDYESSWSLVEIFCKSSTMKSSGETNIQKRFKTRMSSRVNSAVLPRDDEPLVFQLQSWQKRTRFT
jgi:hypothetical protein